MMEKDRDSSILDPPAFCNSAVNFFLSKENSTIGSTPNKIYNVTGFQKGLLLVKVCFILLVLN